MKPLDQVSYTSTSAVIYQYAVANVSVEISQDDVTGDCLIKFKNEIGTRFFFRTLEQAQKFAYLVTKHYPIKRFICLVDY